MANLIGKTLAKRYRIEEFLGRGGMAEVYKVWDAHRSTYLAMKLLNEDLALDNVFLRRFKREAQILAHLQHPNIVRLYGLAQDGRLVFMLMDYVEGESLKHKIFDARGPMSLDQIMTIIRPLCQALQYAHNEGLVHADVKPANIMIDKTGRVLLSDFGIARVTESATVTMLGAGTPAYMAPEQARGEMPNLKTDIYALGIVLFEMLTGERPFTGDLATISGTTSEKIRWEQLNLLPPSPRKFNPVISINMEAAVIKCLQKDPSHRYDSSLDSLWAIEIAAGDMGKAVNSARKPTRKELSKKRSHSRQKRHVSPQVFVKKKLRVTPKQPSNESKQSPRGLDSVTVGILVLIILFVVTVIWLVNLTFPYAIPVSQSLLSGVKQ